MPVTRFVGGAGRPGARAGLRVREKQSKGVEDVYSGAAAGVVVVGEGRWGFAVGTNWLAAPVGRY